MGRKKRKKEKGKFFRAIDFCELGSCFKRCPCVRFMKLDHSSLGHCKTLKLDYSRTSIIWRNWEWTYVGKSTFPVYGVNDSGRLNGFVGLFRERTTSNTPCAVILTWLIQIKFRSSVYSTAKSFVFFSFVLSLSKTPRLRLNDWK